MTEIIFEPILSCHIEVKCFLEVASHFIGWGKFQFLKIKILFQKSDVDKKENTLHLDPDHEPPQGVQSQQK